MRSNHDVFVGQNFWVQHRVGRLPFDKSFLWPDDIPPLTHGAKPFLVSDDSPRLVSIKHQADVIRRDRLREKEDKKIKRMVILRRNWREPVNFSAIGQAFKPPQPSMKVPELPTSDETAVTSVTAEAAADPRQTRWMFDDKPIPLPEEETPEHIGLARQGDIKTDAPLVKGPEQLESFNKMKQLATEAPVLAFFKTGRPIQVNAMLPPKPLAV
ncbi:uncharacterized protein CPUR_06737 [Claviceps purpurea 20.1]|uniref:Uncharacterized protein n=1 Tax=Claviceps purpurea (strain 20.1) TaxID=1111077 RepID=M1VXE3_CLAP2|nr:uncharacterized protein CPUR_06737 [Claviceps purpurea 20.1]